jgi:hypothetical protein
MALLYPLVRRMNYRDWGRELSARWDVIVPPMKLSRRVKRAGLIVGGTIAVILLAIIAAPYLIGFEHYKPAIADAVKRATGRELVIEGKIELEMFPSPRLTARRVSFANAAGTKGAQMVAVRRVSVSPSWRALLGGEVEIGQLTLVRPSIILETDAGGRPNWEFEPDAGAKQAPGEPAKGFHLTIGKLAIVRGTLTYTDPATKTSIVAENIDATASVGALEGPYEFLGTTTVNGLPLSLDLKVGAPGDAGHAVKLGLKLDIGTLDFNGTTSAIAPNADIAGHLKVATTSMPEFVAKLVRAGGQSAPKLHPAVEGRFTFDGGIEVKSDRVAITDFTLSFGGEQATGSLALSEKPNSTLEGHVTIPSLDADKWRAALDQANGFLPETAKAKIAKATSWSPFPPDMDVRLAANVGELTLAKGKLRDVVLAVDIRKGVIALSRLAAKLPGDMTLRADAASGEITLGGGRPRETLAWFGVNTGEVPKERLHKFELRGKFATAAGKLKVSEAKFELDDVQGAGGIELTLGPPAALALTLDMPRFDVDAYAPPSGKGFSLPARAPPAGKSVTPVAETGRPPDTAGVPIALKAKIGKLLFRTEVFGGVDADVALQGKLLKLNNLRIADALKARVALRGTLADLDKVPKYDLTVDVTAPDGDRLLGFMGVPVLRSGPVGAASLSGGVAGSGRTATLRGVKANFLGAAAQATGTLSFDGKGKFDFSQFSLQTADASRLVSAASGKRTTGIGAVSMSGKLSGSMERAVFTGQGDLHGARMNGRVEATLGARPQIVADLKVPGVLDLDQWLGVASDRGAPAATPGQVLAPKPGVATGNPINTSAFNGFDAKFSLRTSAMMIASLKVDYADVDATLRNGTLTVSKLTGQFYGGGVDMSGTVKTSAAGVALDLRGSVIGLYLAQMLRSTTGKNTFGGDRITIALDGKVNATGMSITGNGRTPAEIRNSLTGTATLGGYIYPAVDQRSRESAQFLAGLGGIFSDDLKVASLVLKRFVNRQNGIEGQASLQGGRVVTNNMRVVGDNAQARLNSSTQVATAVTQTTITFDTGNTGSNLVTTVTGPLSSPAIDSDRVAAAR